MSADENAGVDSDAESIAAVGNVRDAAIKAMQDLLKVDSNIDGTLMYKKGQSLVKKMLERMDPSDEKEKALQIFPAMNVSFESKTCTTWRPYVVLQLQILGEPVEKIEGYVKKHRLTMDDVSWAQRNADAMASGAELEPKLRKKKRATGLALAAIGDNGSDAAVKEENGSCVAQIGAEVEPRPAKKEKRAPLLAVDRRKRRSERPTSENEEASDRLAVLEDNGSDAAVKEENGSCVAQVEAGKASAKAAREQAKKSKKDAAESVKLEKLAARVARNEEGVRLNQEADLRARHEAADQLKELAAKLGLEVELRAKEEASDKVKREEIDAGQRTNEQSLEIAVAEGKRPIARPSRSKVQKTRRGEASGSVGSLDGFFKTGRENVKQEAQGRPGSSCPSSSSASSSKACPETWTNDPKGYYAALQVAPGASYAEIKAAYRRLILQHHPDKGGSTEAFRKVQDAYDFLSDEAERAKYDFGHAAANASARNRDEHVDTAQPNAEVLQNRAAKAAFSSMMTSPRESWEHLLAGIDSEVLKVLASLCEKCGLSVDASARPEGKRKRNSVVSDDEEGTQDKFAGKGLWRVGGGWVVQIAWRAWKIRSLKAIPDLEQAVNLHIACVDIRRAAKSRHKEFLGKLKNMGVPVDKLKCDFDDCDVMTHDEWLKLVREEPFVPIMYCTDLGKTSSSVRVQVPFTPCFQSAREFRALTRRALSYGGDVPTAKKDMSEQAKKDREEHNHLHKDAAALVYQEAARRAIGEDACRRALADTTRANLLCLKETSAEDEIASMKATMEKDREEHRALHQAAMEKEREEHRAALDSSRQEMQVVLQDQMAFARKETQDFMAAMMEVQKQHMEVQLQSVHRQVEEAEKARLAEEEKRQAQARLAAEEEKRQTQARLEAEEEKRQAQAQEEARRQASGQMQVRQVHLGNHRLLENNNNRTARIALAETDEKCRRYMEAALQGINRRSQSAEGRALHLVKSLR